MEIYQLLVHVIHFICFFTSLSIGICEITFVSYYDNKNFIVESKIQRYDFIYLSSIVHILNSLFLYWIFFDKHNKNINKYFIFLFCINVLVGIWNISLYNHDKGNGKINGIIVFELEVLIIKTLLLGLYLLILYLFDSKNHAESYENKNIESVSIILNQ